MKKRIASLIAALAVTAAGTTAYAAKAWAPADLRSLGSFLLGASETGSADLNDDNVSDIFDMIAMRKSLISSVGDYKETTVPATEEYVKLINRNVISDGVTWLVQSGAATEFSVARAKTVSVTIKGDSSVNNGEEHRPRYAILVNDEPVLTECLSEKEKTVKVLDSDTPTNAVIKVIHLSEANNGPVGVGSITVGSDSALPIIPTSQKPLHIEFVGDSITCAYGVEGKDQYENFKTTTENFLKSYAYLTAKKLDADYSTACYSGYGVISSYSSDGSRNTSGLLGDHYDNAAANAPYNIPWDHSTTPVDVTVVNLGTNDNTYCSKDYETRGPEFTKAYVELLGKIHKAHPDAAIICTVGTMGCAEMYPYIEEAVEQFRKSSGMGDKIMCYQSAQQDMNNDGLGSDWHPSYITHQKSAAVLSDKICTLLGLESDQVGIDVAADAKYEVSLNKDAGADAATYFSDFDKSFWVNVVTGGKEQSDVQSVVSPIGLKKGGTYKLTFKATAPEGSKLPVQIRSKDGKTVYCDETFTAKGEKTSFEAEFTVTSDDPAAEFAILFGGKDYSSVTLYELHLVKTA